MQLLRVLLGAYIHEIRGTGHRPHIRLRAECVAGTIAAKYVKDGEITLNIGARAAGICPSDTGWHLEARFGTVPCKIHFEPIDVISIYLLHAESGRIVNMFMFAGDGIVFHGDNLSRQELECAEVKPEPTDKPNKTSHLKLIK